jgi:hypothetical protein
MNSLAEEIRGWLRADAGNRSPADHERVIRSKSKARRIAAPGLG